jgi:hypothetical protein
MYCCRQLESILVAEKELEMAGIEVDDDEHGAPEQLLNMRSRQVQSEEVLCIAMAAACRLPLAYQRLPVLATRVLHTAVAVRVVASVIAKLCKPVLAVKVKRTLKDTLHVFHSLL